MYPDLMLLPMREELTRVGITEARTPEDVDRAVAQPGTLMIVVNSICGCAAGKMRPAVRQALSGAVRPERMISVFAGQDREATERARSYFSGWEPSSPSIALLRDGKLIFFMPRHHIETRDVVDITDDLHDAFAKFCAPVG